MADIPPPIPPSGPSGAVPPPKKETGKVQPKKETVRINLPPKPTAAPTIKLPTLPPGGPTGAPSAPVIAPPPTAPPKTAGPATPAPGKAPAPVQQRPSSMQQQRPPAQPAVAAMKTIDKILIWLAFFSGLAGAGFNVFVFYFYLKPMIDNFQP
jgi:hypothetical protein